MASHFLPSSRVRSAQLEKNPGLICLHPGVLLCNVGDYLEVKEYGKFRVLKIEWTGENHDEACITVEPLTGN